MNGAAIADAVQPVGLLQNTGGGIVTTLLHWMAVKTVKEMTSKISTVIINAVQVMKNTRMLRLRNNLLEKTSFKATYLSSYVSSINCYGSAWNVGKLG